MTSTSTITLLAGVGVSAATYSNTHTTIGAFQLDALFSEGRSRQFNMTKYAVESGANISDYISPAEKNYQLDGVVTGLSPGAYESILSSPSSIMKTNASDVLSSSSFSQASRLLKAATDIETIADNRLPITVVTGMDSYSNLMITNLNIVRKDMRLAISCTLRPLETAETQWSQITAASTAPKVKGKASRTKASAGKVSTTEPAEKVQTRTKSMMSSLLNDGE